MKSRKTYVIIGIIILIVGLLAACGPPRFHGEYFLEHILSRLDDRAEDLNLSDMQKEKYEEIRLHIKTNITQSMERRNTALQRLRDEINGENPDAGVVAEILKERLRDIEAVMTDNLDLLVEFYNVLDEDQKGQVLDRVRKKVNRLDKFGCGNQNAF